MLPTILDERAADQEVIAALLRELKRRNPMSQLLKLADGSVVRVHGEVSEVSQDKLEQLHAELLREADAVNAFIAAPAAEQPSQEAPAPEQPAPAPVDQPAAPEAPAPAADAPADAPAAPAQDPAVITDQSAVAPTVPAPQVSVDQPAADAAAPAADVPVLQ